MYAGIPENSVGKHHQSGSWLLVLPDTVFRTYLAAQSSRFRLGGVAAGKQLFYDSQMVAGDTIVGFTASARFNTGSFAVNAG
ncbi:hypothetical protein [Pseudomonas amygdali]|uniref:hypothetical protein n=1 Tax=Pseudomonas amygdali TaxID=47877 RepID=UPI0012906D69|nr:hypothetical protein [Pseudomonas amygdali]